MSKKVLITGGAGFAGHHVVEHLFKETDWEIVVLDKLTYASNGLDRLRDIGVLPHPRIKILTANCAQEITTGVRDEIGEVDYILHMAAETHVDKSIEDAAPFVEANVFGTLWVLELARAMNHLEQFVYFSTDEVFGPASDGMDFKEWDRYNSSNPYAATKAAGEEISLAYANTHGVPILILHCMNLFGERQHPEKFIPKVIRSVVEGKEVTIHAADGATKPGQRSYIHCRNMAAAVLFLLGAGQFAREKVNIVGEKEVNNLDLAQAIAGIIGHPLRSRLVSIPANRPGWDFRYSLDGSKLASLGWQIHKTFDESLEKTVRWTLDNRRWLYG
ncbi:MAG: NAD-dependent epimerase/dehydratase family protein [Desulfobacterales bacterium]|nr:NAD-dependent epimerase/dehydratase family protein [Desulfobacterales bacterium]